MIASRPGMLSGTGWIPIFSKGPKTAVLAFLPSKYWTSSNAASAWEKAGRPNGREDDMPQGTVKWFNTQKGYGFIKPEDGGADAFVHITAVQRSGLPGLDEGMQVESAQVEPSP